MQVELAPDVVTEPWKADAAYFSQRLCDVIRNVPAAYWIWITNDKHVAVGCARGVVEVHDIASKKLVARVQLPTSNAITHLLFSGAELIAGSMQRGFDSEYISLFFVLNANTFEVRNSFLRAGEVYRIAASSSSHLLAVTYYAGDIDVFDTRTGETLYSIEASRTISKPASKFSIEDEPGSSDGVLHAAVGYSLRMMRQDRFRVLVVLAAPSATVLSQRLLSACGDGRVLNRVLGWLL